MVKKGLIVVSNNDDPTEDMEKAVRLMTTLENNGWDMENLIGPDGITPEMITDVLIDWKNNVPDLTDIFVYIRDQISLINGKLCYVFDGGNLYLEQEENPGDPILCPLFVDLMAGTPQNGTYIMLGPYSNLGTMDQISLKPEVLMVSSGFIPGLGEHDQFDLERQLSGGLSFLDAAIAEQNRLMEPHNPPQDVKIWDHGIEL